MEDDLIAIGEKMEIYYSQDGAQRTKTETTCTVDDQKNCIFETSHLTLFTIGSVRRNNMDFVDGIFRENPSLLYQNIYDAFF